MASEGPPPPYNTSFGNSPNIDYPPPPEAYPHQVPYPPTAPPSYQSHDQSKAYPVQTGAPPYNVPQGVPPAPGYAHGAAPGYTTQAVGVNYNMHAQTTVITQQPTGVIVHAAAPPPDYMVVSIISMFCCVCIGVFAVMKSVKSRDLFRAGDYAGAQVMGVEAKKLAHTSIFVAIFLYVVIVIIRIVLSIAVSN